MSFIARGEIAFEADALPVPDKIASTALPDVEMPPQTDPNRVRNDVKPELPEFPRLQTEDQTDRVDNAIEKSETALSAVALPTAPASASPIGAESRESAHSQFANSRYAALVSAEINRRKHYPAEARGRNEHGVVGVAFTIDHAGNVASYSITKPSGSNALDTEATAMVKTAVLPPPPDGSFHGNILITFRVRD